jgi:hypothetical protein
MCFQFFRWTMRYTECFVIPYSLASAVRARLVY